LLGHLKRILDISDSDAGLKDEKLEGAVGGEGECGDEVEAVAVVRGGQVATPCENSGPLCPHNETGCKVAGLHNSCIHSVTSHSCRQITPSPNHALYHPEFLAPKYRCGHPKLLQLETSLSRSIAGEI